MLALTGGTMSARLWLVEGLPGTGKTTAARRLSEGCQDAGVAARWWIEEAKDHPVTPATLRRRSADPDFAECCVSSFQRFVEREHGVLILEGSAFQSTVRFMYANGWSPDRIRGYLAAWLAAVSVANPRMLILRVDDVRAHFADFVAGARGPDWIERLVAYVARTPIAERRGWEGFGGFLHFWAGYQRLILDLAADLECPVRTVTGWSQGRQFGVAEAMDFFRASGSHSVSPITG